MYLDKFYTYLNYLNRVFEDFLKDETFVDNYSVSVYNMMINSVVLNFYIMLN